MQKWLIVMCLSLAVAARAQGVPGTIPFNARLANSNGQPLSGPHALSFRLFEQATGGAAAWTESAGAVTFGADGLVALELGATTQLQPALFSGAKLFLEIDLDGATLSPRVALGTVPYAFRAGVASRVGTLDEASIQRRVTATCPAGQAMRAIDAMGAVTCEAAAAPTASRLVFRRLMTPRWLVANATFGTTRARNNTDTTISFGAALAGTPDYQRLFTVPLVPAGTLDVTRRYVVRIAVARPAALMPVPDSDPVFGVTDGTAFVGLLKDDSGNGCAAQTLVGTEAATVGSPAVGTCAAGTPANPSYFETVLVIAPGASTAATEFSMFARHGEFVTPFFLSTAFDVSSALAFSVYANNPAEVYDFHSFEVSVERDD